MWLGYRLQPWSPIMNKSWSPKWRTNLGNLKTLQSLKLWLRRDDAYYYSSGPWAFGGLILHLAQDTWSLPCPGHHSYLPLGVILGTNLNSVRIWIHFVKVNGFAFVTSTVEISDSNFNGIFCIFSLQYFDKNISSDGNI